MTPEEWRTVQEQPAVLLDAIDLLPMLSRLRQAPPEDAAQHRVVMLRWADVWRRFNPSEVLPVLEALGPDLTVVEAGHLSWAAVRAATLLELQRAAEARPLVSEVDAANGARDLAEGRLAYLGQDLAAARAHWERADALASLHPHPLSVEVRAEALGYLGRLTIAERRPDDTSVWVRLDRVCDGAGAKLSQAVSRLFKVAGDTDIYETLAVAYAVQGRTLLEDRYAAPHVALLETVAPIPLTVHGIAKAHADDPQVYANTVFQLAALSWRMGDRQVAFEQAWYGRAIGQRLFGPDVVSGFDAFIEALLAPLEGNARAAFEWRMKTRSDQVQSERRAREADG